MVSYLLADTGRKTGRNGEFFVNREAALRQILVVTDGCSNKGMSPVAAATLAREQGITVNVIGVIDRNQVDEQGEKEIQEIAKAGGGLHDIVYPQQLAQTVQMLTRKAMTQTIHQVVNKELKEILGGAALDVLSPEKRVQVAGMVDELGERSHLEVVMLVDTSASMKTKLTAVQQAIHDFSISLRSRSGTSRMAVCTFPGKQKHMDVRVLWTEQIEKAHQLTSDLAMGGITPTGPAIVEAISLFQHVQQSSNLANRFQAKDGHSDDNDADGPLRNHVF